MSGMTKDEIIQMQRVLIEELREEISKLRGEEKLPIVIPLEIDMEEYVLTLAGRLLEKKAVINLYRLGSGWDIGTIHVVRHGNSICEAWKNI